MTFAKLPAARQGQSNEGSRKSYLEKGKGQSVNDSNEVKALDRATEEKRGIDRNRITDREKCNELRGAR